MQIQESKDGQSGKTTFLLHESDASAYQMEQYCSYVLGSKGHHICKNEKHKTLYEVKGGKIMEERRPFISVVMPVYNVEKHLKKAVDSVLKQTYTDFEIILVDDCSPDGCPQLCEELAASDERIMAVHHNENKGLSMARNTGMTYASGKYIWFMDSDDFVEDSLFAMVFDSVKENPAELILLV